MARDYGRVHTAFWNSQAIRSLSDRGKLLANYLLTGPHTNSIGAYLLPDAYIGDDLGWDGKTVTAAIKELTGAGFCERFADGRHIVICKFLEWNPIENPNVGKAAVRQVEQLPVDPAAKHVLEGLQACSKHFPNGIETVLERFRNIETKPCTKPETKHETETEMELPAAFAPEVISPKPVVVSRETQEQPDIPEFLKREPNGKRWEVGKPVPAEWITEAELKRAAEKLAPVNLRLEGEKFVNYWTSKSGKDATKKDWKATWMNRAISVEPPRGQQFQPEERKILKVV